MLSQQILQKTDFIFLFSFSTLLTKNYNKYGY